MEKTKTGRKAQPRVSQPLKRNAVQQAEPAIDPSIPGFSPDSVDEKEVAELLDKLKRQKLRKRAASEQQQRDPKRKYTDDGFAIYTADELKIGKAGSGNTPLCPFDCDCCF